MTNTETHADLDTKIELPKLPKLSARKLAIYTYARDFGSVCAEFTIVRGRYVKFDELRALAASGLLAPVCRGSSRFKVAVPC